MQLFNAGEDFLPASGLAPDVHQNCPLGGSALGVNHRLAA
jgi:hypothetical protein